MFHKTHAVTSRSTDREASARPPNGTSYARRSQERLYRLHTCSVMAVPEKRSLPRPSATTPSARRSRATAAKQPDRLISQARRKFLRHFPNGFRDETYLDWERDYKWNAHLRWQDNLSEASFRRLLVDGQFDEIAKRASAIESRTNLLFSFEKMALRDAVRPRAGAQAFASALFEFLHGSEEPEVRFPSWVATLDSLPRRQTRVLTWPLATVFGFIAQPKEHFFFKPTVTREAFRRCGLPLEYATRPSWPIYKALLDAVRKVRRDIVDMRPRDMIDMQSFLWVQGSDEYPD
jgi:hypothetical protein